MPRGKDKGKKIDKLYDASFKLNQDLQNMFKDAIKPDDVKVFINDAEFMADAKLIVQQAQASKILKLKENDCPVDQTIKIKDMKLDVFGPDEDKAYALDPFLIKNVRRGNTLLEVTPEGATSAEHYIGRKGLTKFFDMSFELIEPESRRDVTQLSMEKRNHKNYQFAGALRALLEGHQVEIVKTLKANGENAQVSWNPAVQAWIISSKNVALVARKQEDVALYNKDSCSFAIEIANCWFRRLAEISDAFTNTAIIEQMKTDFANRTLVGEYVGNQEHQHMVMYNRDTVMFYAIVDNYSPEICLPVDQALALLQKYKLDVVSVQSLGVYSTFDDLCDALVAAFRDVAKGTIIDEEEGSVIYLTMRDGKGDHSKDKVLSLSKLKTIEYRIFRKMREKLRGFFKPKKEPSSSQPRDIVKKFSKEMKDLLEGNETPKPIEYYTEILEGAINFLKSNPDEVETLNSHYITFQQHLFEFMAAKNKIEDYDQSMFDSRVLDTQDKIEYSKSTGSYVPRPQGPPLVKEQRADKPKNLLYTGQVLVFCPPGVLNGPTLDEISKTFEYKTQRTLDISVFNMESLAPSKKPLFVQVYTVDDPGSSPDSIEESKESLEKTLENLLQTYPGISIVLFGFNTQGFGEAVDALRKGDFAGFKRGEKTPAELNNYFQNQGSRAWKELKPFLDQDIYKERCFDMNNTKDKVPEKLLKKAIWFRNKSSIEIESPDQDEVMEDLSVDAGAASMAIDTSSHQIASPSGQTSLKAGCSVDEMISTLKHLEEKHALSGEKLLIAILPFGIPGSGKSTFLRTLTEIAAKLKWTISSISSDGIRKELMDALIKKGATVDDAFQKTSKSGVAEYNKRLDTMVKQSDRTSSFVHILFLDKNHPPNNIEKTLNQVEYSKPKISRLIKLYLVPSITQPMDNYSLSASFLMQCYYRLQSRSEHETLTNSDPAKATQILLMFFKMYFREYLSTTFLRDYGFDGFFEVPLAFSDELVQVPSSLVALVDEILKSTAKGQLPNYSEQMQEFMDQAKQSEASILKNCASYDKAALEFAILDQLLLATRQIKAPLLPYEQRGLIGRAMSKDQSSIKPPTSQIKSAAIEETKSSETSPYIKLSDIKGKLPLYVGIKAENDNHFKDKLKEVFQQGFGLLQVAFPDQGLFPKMLESVSKLFQVDDPKTDVDGYKIRPTYHVTALFGCAKNTSSPIFKSFEIGRPVNIVVRALLFVPGKIVTAVCSLEQEIENKFPHMTLLLGKWAAKESNMALEHTCKEKTQPFRALYEYALSGQKGGPQHSAFAPNAQFSKDKANAYFVVFENPIVFEGINAAFDQ